MSRCETTPADVIERILQSEVMIMTFLISWQIYQGRTHDVLAHFAQLTKEQDDA
ncbi:hypothetical protein JCM19237_2267 [Photobacterium aphoticum]|uniref:Uncharacterized protein n=1 Tax=Photobacterium aphoticum TaxID=754436 RepID=A0A090QMH0_9GAMM|nr:hypothetical protein JCM19237_2267 [Photobacterium aphoticum]